MAKILHKRGTLAQLATAAGNSELTAGEPYYITDLEMQAVATGVDSYVFVGVLTLGPVEAPPSGYIGVIARTS